MSEPRPSIRVEADNARPLVIKEAADGVAADRLRSEISILRAAQQPGVVTLVDSIETAEMVSMSTRYCGSRTLANIGSLTVQRVAGTMAALATTVADLHDLGIRHLRITADHVLIAGDGRPVLCGFGEASTDRDSPAATDVEALGALLQELLIPLDDLAPIPVTRLGRRGAWSGYQRRALLNLADQATADDPFVRPTARQLAHNLLATVPDAELFDDRTPDATERSGLPYDETPADDPTWWQQVRHGDAVPVRLFGMALAGAALIATLGVGAARLTSSDNSESPVILAQPTAPHQDLGTETSRETPVPSTTAPAPTTTSTTTSTTSTTKAPSTAPHGEWGPTEAAGCSTIADQLEAATTADGNACPTDLTFAGGVLRVSGEQFEVGTTRAAVAIGDFTCRGTVQAAVVDLDLGDVYVFDRWAIEAEVVSAHALARVPDARRVLAEGSGSAGCHRLVVLDQFGIRHVIDPTQEATS